MSRAPLRRILQKKTKRPKTFGAPGLGVYDLGCRQYRGMMITLYRTDSAGLPHYYTLHDRQGHLFSELSFTVSWGRNMAAAREKVYQFENPADRDKKLRELLAGKLTRGYKVLYSYLRRGEMKDIRPVLRTHAV